MTRLLGPLSCVLVLVGCASLNLGLTGHRSTAELAEEGRSRKLPLVDPLDLPPEVSRQVVAAVGLTGTPTERVVRLRRWLRDADPAFIYSEESSYPAGAFFQIRRGDCFSFTNIFIAMARSVGVDARYVYVRDVSLIHQQANRNVDTSHIAAEYGTGPRPEVIDYFQYPDERTLAEFTPLSDEEASALFNSNLAVGYLQQGKTELAESMLEFLMDEVPSLPELRNNLAVALISNHHLASARGILQSALAEFPAYAPLYANAMTVANAQGDEAMARSLEISGKGVAEDDPLFVFSQGMRRYRRQDYSGAVERFERVTHLQEQSAMAWAWLSRAESAAGNLADSSRASRQAMSLGSSDPRVLAVLAPIAQPPSSK